MPKFFEDLKIGDKFNFVSDHDQVSPAIKTDRNMYKRTDQVSMIFEQFRLTVPVRKPNKERNHG